MTILHRYSIDIQHLMNESEGLISNNKLPLKYKILACFPQMPVVYSLEWNL